MPRMIANGVDLYYEIHGQGAPLMLIAGLASDSQSWQPILKELSQHYQLIVPDNRGVGRTTPPTVATSIAHIADDCMALISQLGLSSVALCGHSMGGFVALDCAIRYPDQVTNLILAGTSAYNSESNNALFLAWAASLESRMAPEQWFRNIFSWIFSDRFLKDEAALDTALRWAIEYPYPQSTIAFKNQVNAIRQFNCLKDVPHIRAKTLILSGEEDLLFPPETSSRVLGAIPGAEFSLIEHAAHALHTENPEAFTASLFHFLKTSTINRP